MRKNIFKIFVFFIVKIVLSDDYEKQNVIFFAKKEKESNELIARKGILVKRENSPATILILHGYGHSKFEVGPFRLFFRNYNCMTFDFRAHGESIEDQFSTIGHDEIYDLFGAIDFIKSQSDFKDKPIFIWAPSMGAATAIEAQSIDPKLCDGMVLDSPFSSSEDLLKQGISKLKLALLGYKFDIPGCSLLQKYAFNPYVQPILKFILKLISNIDATKIETFVKPICPKESIKNVKIPCFFIVCRNDEKVKVESVIKVYENHVGYKRLWITNGRDHCDSIYNDPERYVKLVNDFFKCILNKKIYCMPNNQIIRDPY